MVKFCEENDICRHSPKKKKKRISFRFSTYAQLSWAQFTIETWEENEMEFWDIFMAWFCGAITEYKALLLLHDWHHMMLLKAIVVVSYTVFKVRFPWWKSKTIRSVMYIAQLVLFFVYRDRKDVYLFCLYFCINVL